MRILVADDHEIVRKGVCAILESRKDIKICGEATNGVEAIQKSLELLPDLVIMDVTMPVLDGLTAAMRIKAELPAVAVLVLSMHDSIEMARVSRVVGAQGFVTKEKAVKLLLEAIDTILAGGTFFPSGSAM